MTVKAGIFDLDGTLYFNDDLSREIGRVAAVYISEIKGVNPETALALVRSTRKQLAAKQGFEASLSAACEQLGGNLRDLHAFFSEHINPESYLTVDPRVVNTLKMLSEQFPIYIYTNNNVPLTSRIMSVIGVENIFERIFTIEDFWIAKPDLKVLGAILKEIGREPAECLFVGDRYDIDLRLPEQMGAKVHTVKNMDDFLNLNSFVKG